MNHSIKQEDLLYGIRSSFKVVEKLSGIIWNIQECIRHYKSFRFVFKEHHHSQQDFHDDMICYFPRITIQDSETGQYIDLMKNQILRIHGPNGAGKTTLMNKLLGLTFSDATTNAKSFGLLKRSQVAYVSQQVPAFDFTLGQFFEKESFSHSFLLKQACYQKQLQDFTDSIDMDKKLCQLSGGQAKMFQLLVYLTKAAQDEELILFLDEPTNNLDSEKVFLLIELLNSLENPILMISHCEEFVGLLKNVIHVKI